MLILINSWYNKIYKTLRRNYKMRLIPINCIKEGSILGKKLQNSKGDILLREGVVLDSNYINKIINYGISWKSGF